MPAHVFVEDVAAPALAEGDRHHLERVLRLRDGEAVSVADGAGGWRECVYRRGGGLEPVGDVERRPRRAPAITVAFALTKGDRPETAVQKLTEVGVDHVVLFAAERSVARWDEDRAARHLDRLRKVAREAAMQSRRAHLPTVDGVRRFADVAALPGASLADAGGDPPSLERPVVLIGPEGGWSPQEREARLPTTALGAHVLRAETAAIVAGALLVSLRSGLVEHGGSLPTRS